MRIGNGPWTVPRKFTMAKLTYRLLHFAVPYGNLMVEFHCLISSFFCQYNVHYLKLHTSTTKIFKSSSMNCSITESSKNVT